MKTLGFCPDCAKPASTAFLLINILKKNVKIFLKP